MKGVLPFHQAGPRLAGVREWNGERGCNQRIRDPERLFDLQVCEFVPALLVQQAPSFGPSLHVRDLLPAARHVLRIARLVVERTNLNRGRGRGHARRQLALSTTK